jgi:hypothetical protein
MDTLPVVSFVFFVDLVLMAVARDAVRRGLVARQRTNTARVSTCGVFGKRSNARSNSIR